MAGRQPEAEKVSRRIDEILEGAEFGRSDPGAVDRIRQWISDLFARLEMPGGDSSGSGTGGYIVFALLTAALIAFVVWWLRRAVREHTIEEAKPSTRRKSVGDWNAEASNYASRGQYRDAVRCRYKGLVASLAERNLLREVPGRTAGELRSDIRRDLPAAERPFNAASSLFERAWYGLDEVSERDLAEFDRFSDDVQRVSR